MAGLSCGAKCAKIILFIFNGLFFLSGALLLAVGIWIKVDPNVGTYFTIAKDQQLFDAAAILLIVVGVVIFIVGFFGCCGACKENACMLCTYIVFIAIIIVVQIVAAVLAGVFRKEVATALQKSMAEQASGEVLDNYMANSSAVNVAWQSMQVELKCCGGYNYLDYRNNTNFVKTVNPVPKTCCRLSNTDSLNPEVVDWGVCTTEAMSDKPITDTAQLWADGCFDGLVAWLDHKAGILIGLGVGIAVIEILGIIFACCVRREIGSGQKYA